MTTIHRILGQRRPLVHPQSSSTKQRCELTLLLSLFTKTGSCAEWIQVLRLLLLFHSASHDAGNNRGQVPVVTVAPPLLPSSSQTASPSLLPQELISSRTRRRGAAADKPQAAVDYGSDRSDPKTISRASTSPHRAKTETAPASGRPAFSSCVRALHRPSSCFADPTRHQCGRTCSALSKYPPSRGTSACRHPSRSP